MADRSLLLRGTDQHDVISLESRPRRTSNQSEGNGLAQWTNGQCVFAMSTSSVLSPTFDLRLCRALLEREGFQIPAKDFELPIQKALNSPSVRRYLFFNSSLSHFLMAVVVYAVVWCGVYSTLHLYLGLYLTDFWLLCLSVTLISVLITSVIILVLHRSNKQINMNTDVRLIQVNERLSTHGLMVGLADGLRHCVGHLQLFCVYWDLSPCARALSEALEEISFVGDELQHKLQKRMSHLLLATEVRALDPEGDSFGEEEAEEGHPLLVKSREHTCTVTHQREETKLTKNYSLVPDHTLTIQETAYHLLLTYSAVYVKLLVSARLSSSLHCPLLSRRTPHSSAPLCLLFCS